VKDITTVGSGGWDWRGDKDIYQETTEVNYEACAGIRGINVYFSNPASLRYTSDAGEAVSMDDSSSCRTDGTRKAMPPPAFVEILMQTHTHVSTPPLT